MFCDLVDSTTLALRLDPEEMRKVYSSCQELVSNCANKCGGFVAAGFGDGALIYFGFPQQHENDAERAINAALQILEGANELVLIDNYRPRFHIGIATGHVVIGETIQARGAIEFDVTGETPILASRLQTVAEPGSIVISSETRRLTAGLFKYRDLGRLSLKGFAQPVQAFEVLGKTATESRFEALRGKITTPLFGREQELEYLAQRWEQAKHNHGQVVLLSGEPGIGKSRLTMMFSKQLADVPHTRFRYFCSPIQQGSPFHPIITQIEHVAHIARDDTTSRKLEKLREILAPGPTHEDDSILIADLLSLIADRNDPRLPPTPQRRREKTIRALLRQLDFLAAQRPLLLIFEDAHWSDPSTLQLLELLIKRMPALRALLIVTFRPEFVHNWSGAAKESDSYIGQLALTPLAHPHCVQLVEAIAGRGALFPGVIRKILERADGIPLFLEELTQTVIEAGNDQPGKIGGPASIDVPMTLHASLMARLERFSDAKAVMQIGAAIGREFSYDLLKSIAEKPEWELRAALDQLAESGLLQRRGTAHETTYLFKHALLQEAAYNSILRHMRPKLHRRIFDVLKQDFPESEKLHPDVLAHHCSEARMIEEAASYWLKAGQYALGRSANVEANDWLHRGLKMVGELPQGEPRYRLELDLCVVLARSFFTTIGYTSEATIQIVERARRVCDLLGEPPQLAGVLNGQWVCALMRSDLRVAQERAQEMLTLGEARKKNILIVLGCRSAGITCFARGEFVEARAHLERGLALYDRADQPAYASLALWDVEVLMLSYLSFVLAYLGCADQARAACERNLARARELSQAISMAHALAGFSLTQLLLRAPENVIKPLDELEKLNEEHALFYYRSFLQIYRGWAASELGEPQNGIELIKHGLTLHWASGSRLYEPDIHRWLASAYVRAGQYEAGLEHLDEASRLAEATEAYGDDGEVHRVRAEILLALGNSEAAEASYRAALKAAERRGAGLWRLRSATGLARLLDLRGVRSEARRVLQGAYKPVSEGFDTPDVKEARALLDQLI